MISTILRSKLLVIAIIIVVLGGAWYGLTASSPSTGGALTSAAPDVTGDEAIIQKLDALQTVTLSGDVFNQVSYPTLKDYSTAIIPEPVGRPDPFAPLESQSVDQSGDSAGNVQIFKPVQ